MRTCWWALAALGTASWPVAPQVGPPAGRLSSRSGAPGTTFLRSASTAVLGRASSLAPGLPVGDESQLRATVYQQTLCSTHACRLQVSSRWGRMCSLMPTTAWPAAAPAPAAAAAPSPQEVDQASHACQPVLLRLVFRGQLHGAAGHSIPFTAWSPLASPHTRRRLQSAERRPVSRTQGPCGVHFQAVQAGVT